MTIIIGLAPNNGDRAVVIGADRAQVRGPTWLAEHLMHLDRDGPFGLVHTLSFLKRQKIDRVHLDLQRKIDVTATSALAHTGSCNEAHERATRLLLRPGEWVSDTESLREILFPVPLSEATMAHATAAYQEHFSLFERLRCGYSPEIRRIFDLTVVGKHEIELPNGKIAYWDRNYNTRVSEYVLGIPLGGPPQPTVLAVSVTGSIFRHAYTVNGCGSRHALAYLREQLGTHETLMGGESIIDKKISLTDAVDIVRGAIAYTNERNDFCKGLDYVIVTADGVETHFSDEEEAFEVDLNALIDHRVGRLQTEIDFLRDAKATYALAPLDDDE